MQCSAVRCDGMRVRRPELILSGRSGRWPEEKSWRTDARVRARTKARTETGVKGGRKGGRRKKNDQQDEKDEMVDLEQEDA